MIPKKQYKVLNPIAHGGRVERGEILLLDEYEAQNFAGNVVLIDNIPAPEVVVEAPLEDMSLPELRKKAKALELISTGTKADLLERIKLHLA